jgi:hypothetical protein
MKEKDSKTTTDEKEPKEGSDLISSSGENNGEKGAAEIKKNKNPEEVTALKLMKEHKVSKIYRTSDGTWFTLKNNADNHALALGTKTVEFVKPKTEE